MYTPAHRAAVIELAKRCLLPQDAAEAEAIVDILTRATFGAVSEVDGKLQGVALASAGHKDEAVAHLDLLLVDPAVRRQGIARGLLADVERQAKKRGLGTIKVAGNAPDYAWPGVDVHYTAAICALTAAGYTHERTAWNMTAQLPVKPRPARPAPEGVVIRRVAEADLELLLPMVHEQWGPAWTVEVERAFSKGGVHAAFRGEHPIAFAAWGGCRPSWFGPMGTLPAASGTGLGSVLLRLCLDDQAALGLTSAQIGWVGPVPFYANAADAIIDRVFFLFTKQL
ncbi:GNAT family N-acetyltransferase [Allorhizocola rhizosphaerae]|uniref:GNAT family N-acetyltransferase n=1 Tax=Allorhizocola rhizosphaerae TaxID=1872709 RepID=UPI000E3D3E7A|nr:GNAT family N-acetyltransferase [Allorhizocola rhizosphaerae]